MSRLTPLFLLVLVAGLGFLALRQTEREAETASFAAEPLFQGVEVRRVVSVRVENIKSSRHIRVERDRSGRWYLTDPMAWPAEKGVIDKLLQVVEGNRSMAIPEELLADAESSFEPPRGFIETTEILEDGSERRVRVEVGGVDLDGRRIYVRRDGRVGRTLRNIEGLFNFQVSDFRDKKIFTMSPTEIVSIERVGGWYEEGADEALGLKAAPEGLGWRLEEPYHATGDPVFFTLWTRFLGALRVERFASDRPDEDITRFGLQQPWLTLTITSASGVKQGIDLAVVDSKVYCRRVGGVSIFELSRRDSDRLREPATSFFESALARFERPNLESVDVVGADEELRIKPTQDGWTVAGRAPGEPEFSMDLPADTDRVEDILTAIEGAEILRTFLDVKPADFFPADAARRALWVNIRSVGRAGGYLGEAQVTRKGTRIVPLLREGDSVVQAIDPSVAEALDVSLTDLLDRNLWQVQNARQRGLVIESELGRRAYIRADEFDWRAEDVAVPARELDPVLDHLLFLRADVHVPEGAREELESTVSVQFTDYRGAAREAVIGLTATGEAQVQVGPLRAVLARQRLHADLVTILTPAGG